MNFAATKYIYINDTKKKRKTHTKNVEKPYKNKTGNKYPQKLEMITMKT